MKSWGRSRGAWSFRSAIRRKGSATRAVARIGAASAAAQALLLLISPVLSRIYTPSDFGVLAALASPLLVIAAVASFRLEAPIPVARTDDTARVLALVSIFSVLVVTTVLGAIVGIWWDELAAVLDAPEVVQFLWVLPVGVLVIGTYNIATQLALRARAYNIVARTRFIQGVTNATTSVILGLAVVGPLGLLVGVITGQSAGILSYRKVVTPPWRLSSSWRDLIRDLGRRYWAYPCLLTPTTLANQAVLRLIPFFLVLRFSTTAAGLYLLATRVVEQPASLIGTAAGHVYVGEFSHALTSQDHVRARQTFRRVLFVLATIGIPLFAVLALVAPFAFAFIFGDQWREAGVLAQLAMPMFLLHFISSPLGQTLPLLERPGSMFVFSISRATLLAGVLAALVLTDASLRLTVAVFALVNALTYIALLSVGWRQLTRTMMNR